MGVQQNFNGYFSFKTTFLFTSGKGFGSFKMIKRENLKRILESNGVITLLCSIESFSSTNPDARTVDVKNLNYYGRVDGVENKVEEKSENYFDFYC